MHGYLELENIPIFEIRGFQVVFDRGFIKYYKYRPLDSRTHLPKRGNQFKKKKYIYICTLIRDYNTR